MPLNQIKRLCVTGIFFFRHLLVRNIDSSRETILYIYSIFLGLWNMTQLEQLWHLYHCCGKEFLCVVSWWALSWCASGAAIFLLAIIFCQADSASPTNILFVCAHVLRACASYKLCSLVYLHISCECAFCSALRWEAIWIFESEGACI